jgi:hypothetical protein
VKNRLYQQAFFAFGFVGGPPSLAIIPPAPHCLAWSIVIGNRYGADTIGSEPSFAWRYVRLNVARALAKSRAQPLLQQAGRAEAVRLDRAGASSRQIARMLTARGARPKRGGSVWHAGASSGGEGPRRSGLPSLAALY